MKNYKFTPHQKAEDIRLWTNLSFNTGRKISSPQVKYYGVGFIEWPEINFEEIKDYYIENKVARIMYQGLIALLFLPEILIRSFHEVLKFKV